MAVKTKPMPTIGVSNYTYFPITEDSTSKIAYGKAVSLPGTVEITPSDSGGSDTFSADNGPYVVETYIEKMGHEIENADIPASVEADWRGMDLKNNGMLMKGDTKLKYFGVAWKLTKADNSYRYVKYFKGAYSSASSVGGKTRPVEGASEKKTATATFTAVKTDYSGLLYYYVDSDQIEVGDGKSYETLEAFEKEWFSDMSCNLDDTNISTVTA